MHLAYRGTFFLCFNSPWRQKTLSDEDTHVCCRQEPRFALQTRHTHVYSSMQSFDTQTHTYMHTDAERNWQCFLSWTSTHDNVPIFQWNPPGHSEVICIIRDSRIDTTLSDGSWFITIGCWAINQCTVSFFCLSWNNLLWLWGSTSEK